MTARLLRAALLMAVPVLGFLLAGCEGAGEPPPAWPWLLLIPLAALVLGALAWRSARVDPTPPKPKEREVWTCNVCGTEAPGPGCINPECETRKGVTR